MKNGSFVRPAVLALFAACATGACAQGLLAQAGKDLADLSLEQLASIEVTSVSRRAERLADVAGSVYVISAEDIRRSGATTLPEALRLAPNVHVARVDANQYGISARGGNSSTANKMLVLIDGRTVYSPLFSGVFWDVQDVVLEDVERIEVLSGSGGTMWGSNAVNGFINVITKNASMTQGTLASVGLGNRERNATVRRGWQTDSGASMRIYGRYAHQSDTHTATGASVRDASDKVQAGFRRDWGDGRETYTLQGDIYSGRIELAPTGNKDVSGANLLGRWLRDLGEGSSLRVQAYLDRTERDQPGLFKESLDTLDLELQRSMPVGSSHRLLFGGGYRVQWDNVPTVAPILAVLPNKKTLRLANLFAQDEIALRDGLDLTLALKLEHNVFSGLETLPSARIGWKVAPGHLLWAAASRTVRIPSRIDREFFVPAAPPFTLLAGGANFDSEVSRVIELGYRAQPHSALSYSLTVFHHAFDRQRSIEPGAAGPIIGNGLEGSNNGIEGWASWRLSERLRLNAGAVQQRLSFNTRPGFVAIGGAANLGNDPNHYWSLGGAWDFANRWELDFNLRGVGALPNPAVPAYTALNARLGWKPRPDLELSVIGQNLNSGSHPEFGTAGTRSELDRRLLLRMVWRP